MTPFSPPSALALLLLGLILAGCAAPASPTPAFTPVDAAVQARQLGRGVNFGNALEAPTEGEWGMTLEARFFDLAKAGGFQTIRLPVRWSAHAAETAPYTIDPAFFERVDWAIAQATSRGLNIVVNIHHYEALMADPAGQRERFLALWAQIAERYQHQPASVLFELCNEPNGISARQWNTLAAEALAVVRQTNPTRNVVIGGVEWNSLNGLLSLELPEADRQVIATFHYYLPFEFTHQGAEWVAGADAWLGRTWEGSSNERVNLTYDLDRAAQWAADHQRPVWLGEFGAYSKADLESRARWTSTLAREAEAREITWAYWEFGAGFGVYDRAAEAWNTPLLRALVPAP